MTETIRTHREIEDTIIIRETVGELPDRLRETVELYSYGYTQQEIADELGKSQRCIGKRLEKAFNLMKKF